MASISPSRYGKKCLDEFKGLWDYAITPKEIKPEKWDGSILVPYPVESAISGVRKRVSENENLWYKRDF